MQAVKEAKANIEEFDRKRMENVKAQSEGTTSAQLLGRFFRQASPKAEKIGKARLMMEDAVRRAERLLLEKKRVKIAAVASKTEQAEVLAQELFHTPGTLLTEKEFSHISQEADCEEVRDEDIDCNLIPFFNTIRTADGTCNNLGHPAQGSSLTAFRRFIPPRYEDGLNQLNGYRQSKMTDNMFHGPFAPPHPSARLVSSTIINDRLVDEEQHTHLVMQWGQFMDHDLDLAVEFSGVECNGCASNDICAPVQVPKDDQAFGVDKPNGGECLVFRRTIPVCRQSFEFEPRQQINELTHYIDGSMVYGSTKARADFLRENEGGRLKEGANFPTDTGKPSLPEVPAEPGSDGRCATPVENVEGEVRGGLPNAQGCCPPGRDSCFVAGDVRVNEQLSLTVMHTIWLREHNRVARALESINSQWDDERIYQEARKIVIAQIQQIHYREYLPAVFGQEMFDKLIGPYANYQPQLDVTVPNAFATAAYRFGHSQIQNQFDRLDASFEPIEQGPLSLVRAFMNPQEYFNGDGTDPMVRGWISQPARRLDEFLNSILTSRLFEPAGQPGRGMDLATLNIQRGRDHGLPPYPVWRDFCQTRFPMLSNFTGFANELTKIRFLQTYGSLDTVDLFVGGLAEEPLPGALIGPTFACIFATTFSNLREGDRFWYENTEGPQAFTPDQLAEIKKTSMSRVFCDNADAIQTIQANPFLQGDKQICLFAFGRISFEPWREDPLCYKRVRFEPHDRKVEFYFMSRSTSDDFENYPVIEDPNTEAVQRCIPFQCPTRSRNSIIATFPTITDNDLTNFLNCRLTVNPSLPANTAPPGAPSVYHSVYAVDDVQESSGLFENLVTCRDTQNIALTYDCGVSAKTSKNEKLASTEELELELVRILAEGGVKESKQTRYSDTYLERIKIDDPNIPKAVQDLLREDERRGNTASPVRAVCVCVCMWCMCVCVWCMCVCV